MTAMIGDLEPIRETLRRGGVFINLTIERQGKAWQGGLTIEAAELGKTPVEVMRQRLVCLLENTVWPEMKALEENDHDHQDR